jgi:hypothetical protein
MFLVPLFFTISARAESPYAQSPLITKLDWAPKDTITRSARGSDNFPLTWADDDHLYTAYGDGRGFEPLIPEKLSLGLARIKGPPSQFSAQNLRAPTLEQKGDGKAGQKASGILMVDGTLYLLLRNAQNSRLAWSKDHGQSWTFADWKFTTSFGCPTFLNFGRNYAGARDDFVYIYSHNSDSAYLPADHMVLARVPKTKITERAAYEFFKSLESQNPAWTPDISHRGPIFTHKGKCYRTAITYNAPLKRYLWCHTIPTDDPPDARFKGGLAIFDSPNPWGPWTTAFYSDQWDVGPGETSSFPTKWISEDGKTLHLVFSGDDFFSIRRATLHLSAQR